LLAEVEKRLQAKGCVKCYLLVFAENERAIQFYENRGWFEMKEDRVFGKEFP
jgi:ribosomal protein S18 acetylase RimI-like enzyme